MNVIETTLPGVVIIEPKVFGDTRGFFYESFHNERYKECGLTLPFVQDNISQSSKNVLRGLHYQLEKPQGKLIWVMQGKVLDIAVDIRHGSPTFGQFVSVVLDAEKPQQIYIPPGFAHGFCVLSATAIFYYKCTDYYHPISEKGVIWNDADLKLPWPIDNPLLSSKDSLYPTLNNIPQEDLPHYA
jgi:dTDP-4-dehydrorhamnose 3,5-epimerase